MVFRFFEFCKTPTNGADSDRNNNKKDKLLKIKIFSIGLWSNCALVEQIA